LLLVCLLSAQVAKGQGTMLFAWHGNSNLFQASFQVTQSETQPGVPLGSQVFYDSLSVTNPVGNVYHYDSSAMIAGCLNPWAFGMTFFDFGRSTELFADGGEPPRGGMAGLIQEKQMSGPDLWDETGFWTAMSIPEPSAITIFALAGCTWLLRRRGGI